MQSKMANPKVMIKTTLGPEGNMGKCKPKQRKPKSWLLERFSFLHVSSPGNMRTMAVAQTSGTKMAPW